MPRGVRKAVNYEEELMKIDAQITRHTKTIAELREQRTRIMDEKEKLDLQALRQAIQSSGMTIQEISELLRGQSARQEHAELTGT